MTLLYMAIIAIATAVVCVFVFGRKKGQNMSQDHQTLSAEAQNSSEFLKTKEKAWQQEKEQLKLAEVDKLKKKIKELEDEIEENEDDLDATKKKFKNKENEFIYLQSQYEKESKVCKQLKNDLENIKEQLEDKTAELSLKAEFLLFVQEILSAKVVSDPNIKNLHTQIDNVCSFVAGEMRDTILRYSPHNHENAYFGDGLTKWAITSKKTWILGKTTIAFVGEFSAGKTSIVNRILSQDNPNIPKLPVSTKATTAIPTYISGGVGTSYNFVTPDNIQKYISEDTFKRVNKEVLDQVKGVSSLIQYFLMTYKNPNLENLSILDTPGFNSNDKEDAERTIEVINECDALFWVFDINAGTVNRSSISLIKENLKKPLYVVINKVDTKAESEVNKVEELIRNTLLNEGINIEQFIRFSSKANLQDIMKPIKSISHDATNESYIQSLYDLMEKVVAESEESVSEFNKSKTESGKRCDSLVEKYNEAIQLLRQNCEAAAEIPRWEEHFFSKDRYEMTDEEYGNLVNELSQICNIRIEELCDLYNQQMEAQRENQQSCTKFNDAKIQWQEIQRCKDQFDKLIKKLK